MKPSSNGPKPRKLPKHHRETAAIAMRANGLKIGEIANHLNIDRKTVARYLDNSKPVTETVTSAITELTDQLDKLISTEERAAKYANLAKDAKNEAVSLAALSRIDDLKGIVTEKERIRAKAHEPQAIQPLFMLPVGASIQVSVGRPREIVDTQAVVVDPEKSEDNGESNG